MTAEENAFRAQAVSAFENAKRGLLRALETTPDERLHFSPSASARSPLHVAAHAADAVEAMHGNLTGDTFPLESPSHAERYFREREKGCQTREHVIALLDRNSCAYLDWLKNIDSAVLEESFTLPFGMGSARVSDGIDFMATHLMWHTAQIQYIQTIYGDLETHF